MIGGPSEYPALWAFLDALHRPELLSGTIAAIEPFGVFVALDDGPAHPVFPGVGFISVAELSWSYFEEATEIVQVGQRVSCEFLQFDTWNLEARLSLKATQPDPFQAFADSTAVGQELQGKVIKLAPIGVFVQVAGGFIGLVHVRDLALTPLHPADMTQVGDDMTVVVTDIDRQRRRLSFSLRRASRPQWPIPVLRASSLHGCSEALWLRKEAAHSPR